LNHAPVLDKKPRNSRIWPERTTDIPTKPSTYSQKIKRKYYKYFINFMQGVFSMLTFLSLRFFSSF